MIKIGVYLFCQTCETDTEKCASNVVCADTLSYVTMVSCPIYFTFSDKVLVNKKQA